MRLTTTALLLITCISATAQNASQNQGSKPSNPRDEYEQFKRQGRKEYLDFRDKANQEYADFIEKAWKAYTLDEPVLPPEREEFDPITAVVDTMETALGCYPAEAIEFVPLPAQKPQPLPVSVIEPYAWEDQDTVRFVYYGTPMAVRFGSKQVFKLPDLERKTIADAWRVMANKRYNNTIRDCLSIRSKYTLNDWAYLQMIRAFAKAALGEGNAAELLAAFIYTQSGYRTRIVKTLDTPEPEISMYFGTEYLIYFKSGFKSNGIYYYPIKDDVGRIETVEYPFPKEQSVSLIIEVEPDFTKDHTTDRHLQSTTYPNIKATVHVDGNLINFFNDYPVYCKDNDFMTKWAFYANTPMDNLVKNQLYPQLKSKINLKYKRDAVEQLLNFVQTAFPYAYDDKVWGYDRAFFGEETLFYPGSDCEDHAILFSQLVRDLLDLDVLLVYYPGHLATAVDMGPDQPGEAVMVDGVRYTICDPTYTNKRAGRTYPQLDRSKMRVIKLNRNNI